MLRHGPRGREQQIEIERRPVERSQGTARQTLQLIAVHCPTAFGLGQFSCHLEQSVRREADATLRDQQPLPTGSLHQTVELVLPVYRLYFDEVQAVGLLRRHRRHRSGQHEDLVSSEGAFKQAIERRLQFFHIAIEVEQNKPQ
ncbi:hypothetical protein D9M71_451000 [compost metagenome]